MPGRHYDSGVVGPAGRHSPRDFVTVGGVTDLGPHEASRHDIHRRTQELVGLLFHLRHREETRVRRDVDEQVEVAFGACVRSVIREWRRFRQT